MTNKMARFSAYGMAGVGIAAAIGFVFALSLFSNYATDDNAGSELTQLQEQSTQPSSLFVHQDTFDGGSQDMAARSMDSAENATEFGEPSASSMMQESDELTSLQPMIVSIIASDGSTGEIIGEVTPDMQFELAKPVFIRAHLANPNNVQISDIIIALGISNTGDKGDEISTGTESENRNSNSALTQRLSYEQASSFRGNIGEGESIELELYWNPIQTGEHAVLLFSITPDERASATEPLPPITSIPIKVDDE